MQQQVDLCYGYITSHDTFETYHAFEMIDVDDIYDYNIMAEKLASRLNCAPDDEEFNCDIMRIALPGKTVEQIKAEREFSVKTPLGELRIYAKHKDGDCSEDYPGVYIDLICNGSEPKVLACVEYDSGNGNMLTTAYDSSSEEPVVIYHHCLSNKSHFGRTK